MLVATWHWWCQWCEVGWPVSGGCRRGGLLLTHLAVAVWRTAERLQGKLHVATAGGRAGGHTQVALRCAAAAEQGTAALDF